MLRISPRFFGPSLFGPSSILHRRASHNDAATVGIVGAGQIGSTVASALLKAGHSVKVYDPNRANAERLAQQGATWVSSSKDAATSVDVFYTALPAPSNIRQVMEKENVLHSLRKGACWIDHTSTDPSEAKRLSVLAEERGVGMLEAPLTGGFELLKAGMMTTFVGGCRDLLSAHEHLLRPYTSTILHMGPIGTASIVKIISNMLCAVHTVVSGEALALAKMNNVDLVNFFHGIRASAGNSFVFETEAPLIFKGTFDPGFTLTLHCKDLDIGNQLARRHGVPLEVMGLVEQIYRRAMFKYGGESGSSHPPKLLEDDLNISLQADGFEKWTYTIQKVEGGGIGVVHHNVD